MQGPYLRKYGVETKINFVLYEVDGVDLRVNAADAGSDCSIMKNEGDEATCTNDFVDEGKGYSLTLTAAEMTAARIVVYVVDSATKVWLDDSIVIETYGHASAQHALDLGTALANQTIGTCTTNTDLVTAAAIKTAIEAAGSSLAQILEDTGTTLDTLIKDIPTTAEFEARSDVAGTAATPAEVATALTTYDAPTKAEMDTAHALLATVAKQDVIDGIVDLILADTNELQTDDIPGKIATAQSDLDKLTGADGATLATVQGNYAPNKVVPDAAGTAATLHGTTDGKIDALNNISTAQVKAEAVKALNVDTYAEPGQEAPPATATLVKKIGYLYKFLRNKITNDGTDIKVYDDAGTTVDQKSSVTKSGGTVTRGKFGKGA